MSRQNIRLLLGLVLLILIRSRTAIARGDTGAGAAEERGAERVAQEMDGIS